MAMSYRTLDATVEFYEQPQGTVWVDFNENIGTVDGRLDTR